jgi:hypothetical protein
MWEYQLSYESFWSTCGSLERVLCAILRATGFTKHFNMLRHTNNAIAVWHLFITSPVLLRTVC